MNYTEGTKVLDGWTIIRKLGNGSFGTVYQIERKDEYGICEQSALKVISVPQSPEDINEILDEGMNDREASTYFDSAMRDIVREIAVMVEMKNCEHIVRYEAHKVIPHENGIGGDILLRMELLTSLPEYRSTHTIDENMVARMGMDLANALMYCERKGIIHRDIKPQNIFVTESGSFKLGDFGIARRMEQTTGASRKGTEDYMAPEIYLRRPYGTTVDIYSLGLVMYKYANRGRLPFLPLPPTPPSFDDREQAFQDRMDGVPMPPPAEAGEGLSAVILKACEYDPKKRYRSAGELKVDLAAVLRGSKSSRNEKQGIYTDFSYLNIQPEDEDDENRTIGGWAEETIGGIGPGVFQDESEQQFKIQEEKSEQEQQKEQEEQKAQEQREAQERQKEWEAQEQREAQERQKEQEEQINKKRQKEEEVRERWRQVTDQVFSSFVEGGREYMEMPIGEITRVVEARGFEGTDVDGVYNFAYSGEAEYNLKTDQTDMVRLSVWHASMKTSNKREAICRFIVYDYQDTYYNAKMQSTLRKLDLPYAVYFGSTKTEVMNNLGITQQMQEWCQNIQSYGWNAILSVALSVSREQGIAYLMCKLDEGNEEEVMAFGKDGMVFAMGFRADGGVGSIWIGKQKEESELKTMREPETIIDSWMYLDGYPMYKLSFENYKAFLLSFYGCEESEEKKYAYYSRTIFSREREKDNITVEKYDNGNLSIGYSRNLWCDDTQNTFMILTGIPQEIVQILCEIPDTMSEEAYFKSQVWGPIHTMNSTNRKFFMGGHSRLIFDQNMLKEIGVFYNAKTDGENVEPVGGLASSYLNNVADQRTVYDEIEQVSRNRGGEQYEGGYGIIYNENSDRKIGYMNGKGTYYYDNDSYVGEFASGVRNGVGTYYLDNGSYITGHWAGNNLNGVCTQYNSEGNVNLEGIWFNGEFIGGFQ